MPAWMPSLFLSASIILVPAVGLAEDERHHPSESRQFSPGHEAFVDRCVASNLTKWISMLDPRSARFMPEKRMELADQIIESERRFCDWFYEELDVCTPEGIERATEKLHAMLDAYEQLVANGSNGVWVVKRDGTERELTAIEDLRAGRTDYCGPNPTGE